MTALFCLQVSDATIPTSSGQNKVLMLLKEHLERANKLGCLLLPSHVGRLKAAKSKHMLL